MATTRITLTVGWSASPTITAAADTSVLVRNTSANREVFYAVTAGDTAPGFDAGFAHRILSSWSLDLSERGMTLRAGERLWLASVTDAFDVTVTEGAA